MFDSQVSVLASYRRTLRKRMFAAIWSVVGEGQKRHDSSELMKYPVYRFYQHVCKDFRTRLLIAFARQEVADPIDVAQHAAFLEELRKRIDEF